MGISHFGSDGSPAGCGPRIQPATMYGISPPGDTSRRSLHQHDRAAAINIYPEWRLHISAYDSVTEQPVRGARISLVNSSAFFTTSPQILESSSIYQCAGYLVTDTTFAYTTDAGEVILSMDDRECQIVIDGFGYKPETVNVVFQAGSAIPGPEDIFLDHALIPEERVPVTITLLDTQRTQPFSGTIAFHGQSDPYPGPSAIAVSDSTNQAQLQLPPDLYDIKVAGDFPYPEFRRENIPVFTDTSLTLTSPAAGIVLFSETHDKRDTQTYTRWLDSLNYSYHSWVLEDHPDQTPPLYGYAHLNEPGIVITSLDRSGPGLLTREWISHLTSAVTTAQKALFVGSGLGSNFRETAFLNDTVGVQYAGATYTRYIESLENNDPITGGVPMLLRNSADTSDMFLPTDNFTGEISHRYVNEDGAVIRHQSDKKILLFPFEVHRLWFERIEDNLIAPEVLFANALTWLADDSRTGIDPEDLPLPRQVRLHKNYPNPYNTSTTISYTLPKEMEVHINIYNVRGHQVTKLVNNRQSAGRHSVTWNPGEHIASGVYLYSITAGDFTISRKMVFMK